jgi:hypothetical protein
MKPCLILGNGPSLNDLPDDVFASMPSFGCNYIDRQPTYFICIDKYILTNHVEGIREHVVGAKIAYLSGLLQNSSDLYRLSNVKLVNKDTQTFRVEEFMSGFTATYVALKIAYYAGFYEVHLWGVDHSPDWEHFKADYPMPGPVHNKRREVMENHYQLAANVYTRAGRQIINHSHPSKLDMIFMRA